MYKKIKYENENLGKLIKLKSFHKNIISERDDVIISEFCYYSFCYVYYLVLFYLILNPYCMSGES